MSNVELWKEETKAYGLVFWPGKKEKDMKEATTDNFFSVPKKKFRVSLLFNLFAIIQNCATFLAM